MALFYLPISFLQGNFQDAAVQLQNCTDTAAGKMRVRILCCSGYRHLGNKIIRAVSLVLYICHQLEACFNTAAGKMRVCVLCCNVYHQRISQASSRCRSGVYCLLADTATGKRSLQLQCVCQLRNYTGSTGVLVLYFFASHRTALTQWQAEHARIM